MSRELITQHFSENPLKTISTCGLSLAGVYYLIKLSRDYKVHSKTKLPSSVTPETSGRTFETIRRFVPPLPLESREAL
ncbi:unnamed protein product, partial [Allacma fusca]